MQKEARTQLTLTFNEEHVLEYFKRIEKKHGEGQALYSDTRTGIVLDFFGESYWVSVGLNPISKEEAHKALESLVDKKLVKKKSYDSICSYRIHKNNLMEYELQDKDVKLSQLRPDIFSLLLLLIAVLAWGWIGLICWSVFMWMLIPRPFRKALSRSYQKKISNVFKKDNDSHI